jgi:hypothetical protein
MPSTNHSTSTFVLLSVLWLFGGWAVGVQTTVHAEEAAQPVESASQAADSLLLDQYPNAYAAYALRKLRSDYAGPAIRVRRTSDSVEQNIGFAADGTLDTDALTSFVGSADGEVIRWYNQVSGGSNLTSSGAGPPLIVQGGTVETNENGIPILYFPLGAELSTSMSNTMPEDDFTFLSTLDLPDPGRDYDSRRTVLAFDAAGLDHPANQDVSGRKYGDGGGDPLWGDTMTGKEGTYIAGISASPDKLEQYVNNALVSEETDGTNVSDPINSIVVGENHGTNARSFRGWIGELVLIPQMNKPDYLTAYDDLNKHWQVGPTDYHPNALLPQESVYQVDLYDYLETVTESDVTIPTDQTFETDLSSLSDDEKADLWLKLKGASVNKPTMGEPGWYVLDNGNGKGIEATGEVRLMFEPDSGPGNPPRSWENEPAYLYQLDIPGPSGGQGNPYYEMPELGRRAMVTAIVDLMMFESADGSAQWFDMVGKAFLGMAETYRWTGELLPSDKQEAFEKGMEKILDHQIARGPRAVNTNMDMFMLQGAAEFYMATDDPTRKQKCVEVVKRALFGYKDGELESNHRVFKSGGGKDGGVFSSAGFIMEGDQAEIFYGGESKLHLMGAYMAVYDRETDTVPSDWQFLEEVLRRVQEWRTYQWFHNPEPDYFARGSGAGFASRTSAPVPAGQAAHSWKRFTWADMFQSGKVRLRGPWKGKKKFPSVSEIETDIQASLSSLTDNFSSFNSTDADTWSGWSPWTKPTPYLPPEGWYSRLNSLLQNDDPLTYLPSARDGVTFNKTFGGPPLGESWWAYKDTDSNGTEFGFFAEAMPRQGNYAGYYGGKIETFWTDEVGYVLVNRHFKAGSPGWGSMDWWAAHHVWGKDENDNHFTTAWLRGWDSQRSVTWDDTDNPSSLTVNNPFNDSNTASGTGIDGEETGSELEGSVDVENKMETVANGAKVTHTVTSDETDEINELWASLPFLIGIDNAEQNIQDGSLQYWDGSSWTTIPDGSPPPIVNTSYLRLTRPVGSTDHHAYVSFGQAQDVRLSEQQFQDQYQTAAKIRNVHIDLHGDLGSTKTLPASKSVSYTIQTTDPVSEGSTSATQEIPLQKGGNSVSTFVSPTTPAMDSVFAGLRSEIAVVKNEAGEQYRPSENINEIGQWDSEETYAVHATSDVTLSVKGDSLGTPSIELEQGWNWIPYFLSSPLPVEEAVSSIAEDLVLLKDEAGRVYSPEKSIEVLEQMEPGEGYKVYVRQSTTLTYPDGNN